MSPQEIRDLINDKVAHVRIYRSAVAGYREGIAEQELQAALGLVTPQDVSVRSAELVKLATYHEAYQEAFLAQIIELMALAKSIDLTASGDGPVPERLRFFPEIADV